MQQIKDLIFKITAQQNYITVIVIRKL